MFNSFLSLQNLFSSSGLGKISVSWSSVPTLSMQISLLVDDLLWNGGGHQCALFLHVEPDCWLTWLHSHCHIAMTLSWTWFQCNSRWPSSKVIEHNNYRLKCILLRRLKVLHYFASLMTKTQVIFPIVDMCPLNFASHIIGVWMSNQLKSCSFGIPQSNILCMLQVPQYSLCCFQMTFSWWGLNLAHMHTLNMTSSLDAVT